MTLAAAGTPPPRVRTVPARVVPSGCRVHAAPDRHRTRRHGHSPAPCRNASRHAALLQLASSEDWVRVPRWDFGSLKSSIFGSLCSKNREWDSVTISLLAGQCSWGRVITGTRRHYHGCQLSGSHILMQSQDFRLHSSQRPLWNSADECYYRLIPVVIRMYDARRAARCSVKSPDKRRVFQEQLWHISHSCSLEGPKFKHVVHK